MTGTQLQTDGDLERLTRLERVVTAHGHKLETRQPGFPTAEIHRKLGLPIPLAAFSVGSTCWFLGLLLLGARGTTFPNAWIIVGLPFGAFGSLLAGMGEVFTGNTFGCALFLTVAGILFGLCSPFLPWTSILATVATATQGDTVLMTKELYTLAGIYTLVVLGILFILLIASQRTAIAISTSILLIVVILIVFGVGLMSGSFTLLRASGALFILCSANLYYIGTALLLLEVGHPLGPYFKLGMMSAP